MKKIIVEVGSTCTKVDLFDGDKIQKLPGKTIQFKKHYNEDHELREEDVVELIDSIIKLKEITNDMYICGTSIFRSLNENGKKSFFERFKKETGYDFHVISQEKENELTVYGATRFIDSKVCVFIGGGGSTEISIYDNGITESVNTPIGVIDVLKEFPDLADDLATTKLEVVKDYLKQRLNLPKQKAEILILSGGDHEKFARESGIRYESNTLYKDPVATIMMDIETRKEDSIKYYESISLDNIRNNDSDPDWWYATRAMVAFTLVAAEEIGAKYIVPTNIAMAYGLIKELE